MFASRLVLAAIALCGTAAANCAAPPMERICFDAPGVRQQNISQQELEGMTNNLRRIGSQSMGRGNTPLFQMRVSEERDCTWRLVSNWNDVQVVAKLAGDKDAAVAFADIADTINPGPAALPEARAEPIAGCGTAGGQKGVVVNSGSALYDWPEIHEGRVVAGGIIVRLVRRP